MSFDALLAALRMDEGLRLHPYRDTASPPRWTIGYGRNLTDKGISFQEANDMLEADAHEAIKAASALVGEAVWDQLDGVRQSVLANMAFQMGKGALSLFHNLLFAVQDGDFDKAASEMQNSRWFLQTGNRAKRLVEEMRTGVVA